MNAAMVITVLIGVTAAAASAERIDDPAGDARLRRTDGGADAETVNPAHLPDLVGLELTGWTPDDPVLDPYAGVIDPSASPDLTRIVLQFEGLVNPPGPIGLAGLAHDPARHGPNPVYGFVEFDVDGDDDSGGENRAVAVNRFLANAARFGSIPQDSGYDRLVRRPGDADHSFATAPQFERSGAEFIIAMCGCWELAVLDEGGDPDGVFDAGDDWIVSGRFLERAQGFGCLSFVFGDASEGGPSGFGLYDPVTEARFVHDQQADMTTIELVIPMTQAGAAMLTGQPAQPIDFTFGGANHASIEEALTDLVLGAATASGVCAQFAGDWAEIDLRPDPWEDIRPLDPTTWASRAIIGTVYAQEQPDATYAWTDTAFASVFGDLNGDGVLDGDDTSEMESEIEDLDGTPADADGLTDGRVTVPGFGPAFSLFDLDYDGAVGPDDLAIASTCTADFVEPFGTLDLADISAFVAAFAAAQPQADLAEPWGTHDLSDITAFVAGFLAGCD